MPPQLTITTEYFKEYRQKLGFSSQERCERFFGAKDITPTVDFNYIKLLNDRLYNIVEKINSVVVQDIRPKDLSNFIAQNINEPFAAMQRYDILPRLNNQGRRPEQVYFSWMRGHLLSNYFLQALGLIFEVNTANIDLIGDDDWQNIDTFKRTQKADLEIRLPDSQRIRIEMQSGFAGTNDIKKGKVTEAKDVFAELGLHTLAIHFDLYNGQVAFIKLDAIEDNSVHWITRQQMEGQTVFNIEQNHFVWKLSDAPIKFKDIVFD